MLWAIISVLLFGIVTGEPLICQSGSYISADGLTCQCFDNKLFYSAFDGECLSTCAYYGDALCEGNGFICVDNSTSTSEFVCTCPTGFKDDSNGTCIDDDLCVISGSIVCGTNEVCVNLPDGRDTCGCQENFYRSVNGICQEINHCLNSKLNECDQLCNPATSSYTCSCVEGYTSDTQNCVLNSDYVPCSCGSNPKTAICAQINEIKTCTPKQGYQHVNGSNEEMEDINECETGDYQCPEYSTCSNQVGYYTCDCIDGYERDLDLMECVQHTCSAGYVFYGGVCKDPCDLDTGFWCPPNAICMVDETNNPMCRCQLSCQVNGWTPTLEYFSVYRVNFRLPYQSGTELNQQEEYMITRSLEYLFGLGNAEITMYAEEADGSSMIQLDIGVSQPVKDTTILETIIKDWCYQLGSSSQCILPGGTVITTDFIYVEQKYPCEENITLCSSINADCLDNTIDLMPGIYKCACTNGFALYNSSYGVYCKDINECSQENSCPKNTLCINNEGSFNCQAPPNQTYVIIDEYKSKILVLQEEVAVLNATLEEANNEVNVLTTNLNDQQRKTRVVGGVLGAFLGLAIIALIGLTIFYFRSNNTV